jgi:hypothetical protein
VANGQGGGPDLPRPWWKNKWVWIGAGAAAAIVGVGTWILAADRGTGTEWTFDPCLGTRCP